MTETETSKAVQQPEQGKRKYRYYREDFPPLQTVPLHLDLVFDLQEDAVKVVQRATYFHGGAAPLSSLRLNCKNLEVLSVERFTESTPLGPGKDGSKKDFVSHVKSLGKPEPQKFEVDKDDHFLVISLASPVKTNEELCLRIITVAKPTENILEGLYYDYSPEGCPKSIITQCQQYGFQRITPCTDTMDAKTFYTTTIVADKRYDNVITNGDLAPGFHDDEGLPVYRPAGEFVEDDDGSRHALVYHNHITPMAPYLFFLGVGNWVTYRKELEYPDGDTFLLELLAYPGRNTFEEAKQAVWMLHDSIQWTLVACGPEAAQHVDDQKEIMEWIRQREEIKEKQGPTVTSSEQETVPRKELSADDANRLAELRAQLKFLIQKWKKTGYKYTGAVYREIGMDNSNYGGMENVGNTTIVSSCLAPRRHMTDRQYVYQEGVKIHEFYHNINGSEVTGQTPFEIWLNEAVTVHIQRKREDELFGAGYNRLKTVLYAFTPAVGPLAQDRSATSMSVEPEGFNQTQELVSAVTYSKAPEVVRMTELMLGTDKFFRALDRYYTKFKFGNATTMDWFACMEEESGLDLADFQRGWLKRTGYPDLEYRTEFDSAAKSCEVHLKQKGFENHAEGSNQPWIIPIAWAAVKDGKNLKSGLYIFKEAVTNFVIEGLDGEPDFISVGCDWSFYGTIKNVGSNASSQMRKQATSDPDIVNRYFAYRGLADVQKAKIIEGLVAGSKDFEVDPQFVELHSMILFDESLSYASRAFILGEDEAINSRPDLSHRYKEIAAARDCMLQAVWDTHTDPICALFEKLNNAAKPGPFLETLQERTLRRHLMALMAAGLSADRLTESSARPSDIDFPAMMKNICVDSFFMSERSYAFLQFLQSKASPEEKAKVKKEIYEQWSDDSSAWVQFIMAVCSLSSDDVTEQIRALMDDAKFHLARSEHARTMVQCWAGNRKMSLLTEEGRKLTVRMFLKVGKVNQMSAYGILRAFNDLAKFEGKTKVELVAALKEMQDAIDPVEEQSLHNQLSIILAAA